jgi:hypothetical protein
MPENKQSIYGPDPGILLTNLVARVKSFEDANWAETNPTPVSMAEAGFF